MRNSMRNSKQRLTVGAILLLLGTAVALFFSFLLGKAYLGILKTGTNVPGQPQNSKAVTARQQSRSIQLTPVTFYFLQGGVYSDLTGAGQAETEFVKFGFTPHITGQPPYRLYVGFFGSRDDAQALKAYFAEKEISVFVQSEVLNDQELTYLPENAVLVEKWTAHLDESARWLEALSKGCPFGAFEQADANQMKNKLMQAAGTLKQMSKRMQDDMPDKSGDDSGLARLIQLIQTIENDTDSILKDWNKDNYNRLAEDLISFIEAYREAVKQLSGPDKT